MTLQIYASQIVDVNKEAVSLEQNLPVDRENVLFQILWAPATILAHPRQEMTVVEAAHHSLEQIAHVHLDLLI